MNKPLAFALLAFFVSCISPNDTVVLADDEAIALDKTLESALKGPEIGKLIKLVELDGASESTEVEYDSSIVKKDLKVVMEYSFARLIRATNYKKTKTEEGILFERKAKEKKGPVSVLIKKGGRQISSLEMKFEENNYLYQSNQRIQITFKDEKLYSYSVKGSRDLIGLDSSNYLIEVSIESL